jgi:hypothetical protein
LAEVIILSLSSLSPQLETIFLRKKFQEFEIVGENIGTLMSLETLVIGTCAFQKA